MGKGVGASTGSARAAAPFVGAAALAWLAVLVGTSIDWFEYSASILLLFGSGILAVAGVGRGRAWGIVPGSLGFLAAAALLRDAAGGMSSGVGTISLVPVFFTALNSRYRRDLFAAIAGVALFYLAPIIIVGAPQYPDSQYRAALLTVAVSAIIGFTTQRLVAAFHHQAARAESRGEMLERVSEAVHELYDSPAARLDVCESARSICSAAVTLLYEPDTEADELRCSASAGFEVQTEGVVAEDSSMAYEAFSTGQPVLVVDDVESKVGSVELWKAAGCPESVLYHPLTTGGARLGVLVVGWPGSVRADGPRAKAAALLAHEAAGVIARADAIVHLTDEAHTDALTGLPNRRAWDAHLRRSLRDDGCHVICLLDLDHFKQFNDSYGHPAGDRLLKETSAAWRDQLRAGDFLARVGGEEFALLLANCETGTAIEIVERLRGAVTRGRTCSAGIAIRRDGEGAKSVVGRADAALYLAKSEGRDQFRLSAEDGGRERSLTSPVPRRY